MADRRQVLRALLLGGAGLAAPAACGVPSGGKPIVDGPGPTTGISGFSGASGPVPNPDGIRDPVTLVLTYLRAAVGSADTDGRTAAHQQAAAFLTAAAKKSWQPDSTQITVVRVLRNQINGPTNTVNGQVVEVPLQPVGHLTPQGLVTPSLSGVVTAKFTVVSNPQGDGLLLDSPLPQSPSSGMLLDSGALDYESNLYTPQLVYFWTQDRSGLVPDLRYIPVVGPSASNQATEIVNRLLDGAPDWLAPVAQPLAVKNRTTLIGPNVVFNGTEPVINLSYLPDNPDPNAVVTQLRWSLSPRYSGPVELQVAGNVQDVSGDGYATANLDDQQWRGGSAPAEFCVLDKVARPLSGDDAQPTVLQSPAFNKGVIWAALNRDKTRAALVREAPGGGYELWLGRASTDATEPQYQRVSMPGDPTDAFSRPVWLPGTPPRLLVIQGQKLYSVLADGSAAYDFTPSGVNRVRAFAIAPDGWRIALISDFGGGLPTVAALVHSGETISPGAPQAFDAGGLVPGTLTAVAWSRPDRVVLAGRDSATNHNGLTEVSIDGAVANAIAGTSFVDPISMVVAYPVLPTSAGSERGKVRMQIGTGASATAYDVFFSRVSKLVYGAATGTAPSPSASASTAPRKLNPVAPFFLD